MRAAPVPPPRASSTGHPGLSRAAAAAIPPQAKPELPNPAAAEPHFAAAPRDFHAAGAGQCRHARRAPSAKFSSRRPRHRAPRSNPICRRIIRSSRERGRPAGRLRRRSASPPRKTPSARFAGSTREQASTTNFIAAARRAAQAAAASPPADKTELAARSRAPAPARAKESSTITSKIRSLLVGASVVVIVLGTFKMAMTLLDSGSAPQLPAVENSSDPPAAGAAARGRRRQARRRRRRRTPSMTSPTPIGRQSLNDPRRPLPTAARRSRSRRPRPPPSPRRPRTATSPARFPLRRRPPAGKLPLVQIPPTERLPDAIGGPVLRTAALKGDPSAAYEIGVRFAEGKGVPSNFDEAAKWYDRAAAGRRGAGDLPARDPL